MNVVAGWDGVTGVASPLVIGDVFGDASSYGVNNGSVYIGDGAQATGIAVGSRFGPTNVAAYDLVLRGGDNGGGRYAQLGFKADGTQANFDIDGPIDVTLINDLTATGGGQFTSYAQVGQGGRDFQFNSNEPDGNYAGAITIHNARDLIFTGGSGNAAYAQLGNGGSLVDGDLSGTITLTSVRDVIFSGGAGSVSNAQLGHGGTFANGDHSGAINIVSARDLIFTATNFGSYVQLGHGGGDGTNTGDITLGTVRDITFTGGSDSLAFALLGHGGSSGSHINNSGAISVASARYLNFQGGTGNTESYAQLGHGGAFVSGHAERRHHAQLRQRPDLHRRQPVRPVCPVGTRRSQFQWRPERRHLRARRGRKSDLHRSRRRPGLRATRSRRRRRHFQRNENRQHRSDRRRQRHAARRAG